MGPCLDLGPGPEAQPAGFPSGSPRAHGNRGVAVGCYIPGVALLKLGTSDSQILDLLAWFNVRPMDPPREREVCPKILSSQWTDQYSCTLYAQQVVAAERAHTVEMLATLISTHSRAAQAQLWSIHWLQCASSV